MIEKERKKVIEKETVIEIEIEIEKEKERVIEIETEINQLLTPLNQKAGKEIIEENQKDPDQDLKCFNLF